MIRNGLSRFSLGVLTLAIFLLFPPGLIYSQEFPNKPIVIYCGYEAGAATDMATRALVLELQKFLPVPVVVENKAGGGSTVCAGLVSTKKPDGYTLGVIAIGALTISPHIINFSYDPLKDFIPLIQFSKFIGGITVLNDSHFRNIQDLIEYARKQPGISYGSSGTYGQAHLSTLLLAQCKGIQMKHVPFKGAAPAATALMGNHIDFVASGDRCMKYVKQGIMRLILNMNMETRDPMFPDVPILMELGCRDVPATGCLVIAPQGLPDPISRKLGEALRKATEEPQFQKTLKNLDLPYAFKDRTELEKNLPKEYELFRSILNEMGVKKGTKG
jgi:tripartite-type tricarboxylate transporter receptor subunit TctC